MSLSPAPESFFKYTKGESGDILRGKDVPNPDGLLDINSPTFDEDSGRPTGAVRMSNTIERMSFDRFEDYL